MLLKDEDFAGTDRYQIVRMLGAGGMGVVYEAIDRQRDVRVALKTVRAYNAETIYRFKNEFRALAQVAHPNLVALHDLESDASRIFFTMDLVEGEDFLSYVQQNRDRSVSAWPESEHGITAEIEGGRLLEGEAQAEEPGGRGTNRVCLPAVVDRLRSALSQLAQGVAALHRAGKLHRDLKPSNVLVTRSGRVVILDFGLVTDIDVGRVTEQTALLGTIEYVSPEQAACMDLTEASDWYSVGVMLYEALTGVLPFRGGPLKILTNKQLKDPASPSKFTIGVPSDLDTLTMGLLQRQAEKRPTGRQILARLGGPFRLPAESQTRSGSGTEPFVGRTKEMSALQGAFARVAAGAACTAYVHGSSGVGKSLLLRHVLDSVAARPSTVVLTGRCYEQEFVPFKAIDSLIDALSHYLKLLPNERAAALLPRDIHALVRLFPVLRRVEAVAVAPRRPEPPDVQELRRRAFSALREILARIADSGPLVVWIDDLQWGDVDSAALLGDLIRPPDPPTMLLIVSYRSEGAEDSAPLTALQRARATHEAATEVREIAVQPLSMDDSRSLVRELLRGERLDLVEAIARESAGNPLFLAELVRYWQSADRGGGEHSPAAPRLDTMLVERIAALPPQARSLLEIVAVAGRPVPRDVALAAAEIRPDDERESLGVLRANRFIRTSRARDSAQLDTFHDRIRETLLQALDEQAKRARHRRLATAIEVSRARDLEALARHCFGAGDYARAGEWAETAGDNAVQTLAFERAADWFRDALAWRPRDVDHERELHRKLADALANAGRGGEAGAEYLRAAEGGPAADVLEMKRLAADQYLKSGFVEDGIRAITDVMEAFGEHLAPTQRRSLISVLLLRLRLRIRGSRFVRRDQTQCPKEVLTRLDTYWSAQCGLMMADNIRAQEMHTRHLLLALNTGEPLRVGRSFGAEVIVLGSRGPRSARVVDRYQTLLLQVKPELKDPFLEGLHYLGKGLAAYMQGRFLSARTNCEQAESWFRDRCTGVAWEVATSQVFGLMALWDLGEAKTLSSRLPALLAEAEQRGNRYLHTQLRIGRANAAWLVADDSRRARFEVEDAMARWSAPEVHVTHFYALYARVQVDLYEGDGATALRRIDESWSWLRKGMLFIVQSIYVGMLQLRARAALSTSATGLDGPVLQRRALRDARRLERDSWPSGAAFAASIRATVAAQQGDPKSAARLFEQAASGFDRNDMAMYAAAARWRQSEMEGSDALLEAAHQWMISQRVMSPARLVEMLFPGVRLPVRLLAG